MPYSSAAWRKGLFPHENSLNEADGVEEERRLMYVALTRARHRLYLSHAQTRMLHGQTRYSIASRFLSEIPSELLRRTKARSGSWLGAGGGRSISVIVRCLQRAGSGVTVADRTGCDASQVWCRRYRQRARAGIRCTSHGQLPSERNERARRRIRPADACVSVFLELGSSRRHKDISIARIDRDHGHGHPEHQHDHRSHASEETDLGGKDR